MLFLIKNILMNFGLFAYLLSDFMLFMYYCFHLIVDSAFVYVFLLEVQLSLLLVLSYVFIKYFDQKCIHF